MPIPSPTMDNLAGDRPALLRAIRSFVFSVGFIVTAFLLLGNAAWFGVEREVGFISGAYASVPTPDTPVEARRSFGLAAYGVRFVDAERAEIVIKGRFIDAYYRVEGRRVLIEAPEAPGGTRTWVFEMEGDRLYSPEVVLHRMSE